MHQTHPNLEQSFHGIFSIWKAGVDAVSAEQLVSNNIRVTPMSLEIADQEVLLDTFDRILIVGAGKAGAGMVRGACHSLASLFDRKETTGWVNVPEDCVEPNDRIVLHAGRPAGLNEPTKAGVEGAQNQLKRVRSCGDRDVVICLISGGGSALLPLPVDGVSLESKQKMTRFLGQNGATINELNAVRSAISQIKRGGLVRGFQGNSFHTLIISDVLGNPLSVIASGPTLIESNGSSDEAISVLERFDPHQKNIAPEIHRAVRERATTQNNITETQDPNKDGSDLQPTSMRSSPVYNHVIGENKTAVEKAKRTAEKCGFLVQCESATASEGDVGQVAERFLQVIDENLATPLDQTFCLISGGEPTVQLRNKNGKGGRNQHLVLLLMEGLRKSNLPAADLNRIEFLAAGTDGEDGPTDAAGAFFNAKIFQNAKTMELDEAKFLNSNNSYHFFEQVGSLVKTGPTHTNVCDLRVLLIHPLSIDP